MVSGWSFGSSMVSLACITSMCSVQRFCGGHCLRLAFGSFFYRLILAFFFFLLLQSNRFLSTLSSATPGFCAIIVSS